VRQSPRETTNGLQGDHRVQRATKFRIPEAFAIAFIMVVSAFALTSAQGREAALAPENDRTCEVESGGAARSVTYTISNIGESYKKPTDYSMLGRHDGPGLSQWWTTRDTNYNQTTVHNSYPYVVTYIPGIFISGYPKPPQTSWVTSSFYRLTVDAQNISGLATGANKDPWILPIMGSKASDGGWVNMSLYFTYLSVQEFADIEAGVHYANTFYGLTGSDLANWTGQWQTLTNDGWFSELQGHFDFDRNAASKFLGLSSGDSLVDQFNARGANSIASEWRQEWIDDGDVGGPLDIYAAYDYSLYTGNGPVSVHLKLDLENSTSDKLAVWFWSQTWGSECLMVRYLETVGIHKHWEPYMEDWYLNGTLGPTNGDIQSRQTSVFHLTAWRDTDPGSYLSPAWLLEPQHIDKTADYLGSNWVSQFDNYAWYYYGPYYKPTRICWNPGQEEYGSEVHYWQTPRTWDLASDETLVIKLPSDRQGWGIEPYHSSNHTIPGSAIGEMDSNAVNGEWVLGHGWPSTLYSRTYYDPATKTITIPGGSSWEPKLNHDPAYRGLLTGEVYEQGSPTFMLDISRVSHYSMAVVGSTQLIPGETYSLQITPLNLTMGQVACNQTVTLPAVAGVNYGENSHTFLWNESSWTTTIIFESEGSYDLVSQDQYFYLDVTDIYSFAVVSGFVMKLVPGWNMVCVPPTSVTYEASTLGLQENDVITGWNPGTKVYDKFYIVGASPPSLDFTIEGSTGYWIYTRTWENVTVLGMCPTTEQTRAITVPSGGGWVIVGFNTLETGTNASDILDMYSGGSVETVCAYNPVSRTYQSYIVGLPFTDFALTPGKGYWMFVTASGTLTYAPLAGDNAPPVAAFTYWVTLLSMMHVNGSNSHDPDGTVVGYSWNWGDGSPQTPIYTSPTASHYFYPGTYFVSLQVFDDNGMDNTTSQTITVYSDLPYSIWGYVFASDGVTGMIYCNVTITNTRTGGSMVTTTDDLFGYYMIDIALLPMGSIPGDAINVTIANDTAIGWAEGVFLGPGNEAAMRLDVILHDYPGAAMAFPETPTCIE